MDTVLQKLHLKTLKDYRKLLKDLHDLAVVAERRTEEAVSLEEMKRRLAHGSI
jgi:hypothetical protein